MRDRKRLLLLLSAAHKIGAGQFAFDDNSAKCERTARSADVTVMNNAASSGAVELCDPRRCRKKRVTAADVLLSVTLSTDK